MSGKWKEVVRLTTSETHYDKSARPIVDILKSLLKKFLKKNGTGFQVI